MAASPLRPEWVPDDAEGTFATTVMPGVRPPARLVRKTSGAHWMPSVDELVEGVFSGNRSLLSRAITLVESNAAAHRPAARDMLRRLAAKPGAALRVGISGVPGAGKSTFIEALGNFLCDAGHRVAVLAVDPSSSLTGGSILGDKTRMETLSRREDCFIRPSPSGGALGGVARKTRETISVCEAAGFDIVLIETVGVGQSEISVRSMVDVFLLVLIAGAGDELQGMKKGIFEIADVLMVNKADGENRVRAEATRQNFERVIHYLSPATEGWVPPVLAASSMDKRGIDAVWQAILRYRDHVQGDGQFERRRTAQALEWWRSLVEQELRARFLAEPALAALSHALERQILAGTLSPTLAAEDLLSHLNLGTRPAP